MANSTVPIIFLTKTNKNLKKKNPHIGQSGLELCVEDGLELLILLLPSLEGRDYRNGPQTGLRGAGNQELQSPAQNLVGRRGSVCWGEWERVVEAGEWPTQAFLDLTETSTTGWRALGGSASPKSGF